MTHHAGGGGARAAPYQEALLAAIDEVVGASRAARETLDELAASLDVFRRELEEGQQLRDTLRHLLTNEGNRRIAAGRAVTDYQAAMVRLRTAIVRALVDRDGMTVTDVAQTLGVSRQRASRLYHRG